MTPQLPSKEDSIKKYQVRPNCHCWEDYQDYDTGESFTCLLEDEHDGDHVWTNDKDIQVGFSS